MTGQHAPALNWYRALVWNLNEQDEVEAGLSAKIACPVLAVFPAAIAGQFSAAANLSSDIADSLTVKPVSTQGHWLQLEARDEVNSILLELFKEQSALGDASA
jgi:pimeloyl-ACP methyl ester carboxylesterase